MCSSTISALFAAVSDCWEETCPAGALSDPLGHGGPWDPVQKCGRREIQGQVHRPWPALPWLRNLPGKDASWHPDPNSQPLSFRLFPHTRLHPDPPQ